MKTAGYSGTPLPKKLGIKEGHRVGTVKPPPHLRELLEPLPLGARVVALRSSGEPYDVILLFARNFRSLEAGLPRAVPRLTYDGGLWIAWPKKSSPLASDVAEGDVRRLGLATGLVDNKICAVDPDWSGLRFVYRVEDRPRR